MVSGPLAAYHVLIAAAAGDKGLILGIGVKADIAAFSPWSEVLPRSEVLIRHLVLIHHLVHLFHHVIRMQAPLICALFPHRQMVHRVHHALQVRRL